MPKMMPVTNQNAPQQMQIDKFQPENLTPINRHILTRVSLKILFKLQTSTIGYINLHLQLMIL